MTGHKGWYHCTKLYCTWLVPSKVFIPFSPFLFTKPAANTASFLHVCTWCVDYQRRRAIAYASLVTCVQCVYLCLHVCVHIFTIASPSSTHNHSRQPRQYSQLLHATSSSIYIEAPPAQHMYTTKKKGANKNKQNWQTLPPHIQRWKQYRHTAALQLNTARQTQKARSTSTSKRKVFSNAQDNWNESKHSTPASFILPCVKCIGAVINTFD